MRDEKYQQAITKLILTITELDDDEALDALSTVLAGVVPFPPTAVGVATHGATSLAHQFTQTGVDYGWNVPPRNSAAMEQLIFRTTNVLAALVDIMEEQTQ